MKDLFRLILLMMLAYCMGYVAGYRIIQHFRDPPEKTVVIDTVIDTVRYRHPVPVDSIVVRYKTVRFSITDTIWTNAVTTAVKDSVTVNIPIEQKEYRDSTYRAWISGYNVNLDSINVLNRYVVTERRIRSPTDRWGLGLQLGAGYNGDKIVPYVGIGLSYNILTW